MRRNQRWRAAAALMSIGLLAWALPRDRPTTEMLERCAATVEPGIELRADSRLQDDGVIVNGASVACAESTDATRLTLAAHDTLRLVPPELRPERVVVHLDPALPRGAAPLRSIETHAESGTLFAQRSGLARIETSEWLHEFAHLRARGPRPHDRVSRRIFAAIEEGVADYYAAVLSGTARLSGSQAQRDLERPPRVPAEYWVTLLGPSFDPHPFGWKLAAALWQAEKRPGPLLWDLIAGLSAPVHDAERPAGIEATPATVARAFTLRCPERSRQTIARALERAFGLELEPERIER